MDELTIQYLKDRNKYLNMRLGLYVDSPNLLSKEIYNNTNLAVTIFGGISIALAFLHGKELSSWLNVALTMIISLVGVFVGFMIINSVVRAEESYEESQAALRVILKIKNPLYSAEGSIIDIEKSINENIQKELNKDKTTLEGNKNRQKKATYWLKTIVIFMMFLMCICLAYSLMALYILICCPEIFNKIW